MAAIGRTARGLRRIPGYRQPEPPRPRRQQPAEGAPKRRPMQMLSKQPPFLKRD